MAPVIRLLQQMLLGSVGAFFFSLFSLFRFISEFLFRQKENWGSTNKNPINLEPVSEENIQKELDYRETGTEAEAEKGPAETTYPENDFEGEKEESSFLTFKFQTYEEFVRIKKENVEFSIPVSETSSVKEQEEVLCSSAEKIADSVEEKVSILDGFRLYDDFNQNPEAEQIFGKEKAETEKHESPPLEDNEEVCRESISFSEKDSLFSEVFTGSDSDSTSFEYVRSAMSRLIDSQSDGFLSDGDFGVEFELNSPQYINTKKSELQEELSVSELNFGTEEESDQFDEQDSEILEELDNSQNSDFLSEKDFHEGSETINNGEEFENQESESANKLESLWEHQELMEQLKMELKKVKATGLPTILEESDENPRIMEDLKPWKIEEKFHHGNRLSELHTVYKSYKERMRKFDILTYQKMYAIGFLQLKDPTQKASFPTRKSLLSQNFWLLKNKGHGNYNGDPMIKFMKELQSDLEVVYVGQMALSWEFLQWQYGKALDIWESDQSGIRQYNEVADEFQQFQVLIQRFLEDEGFQGPRIEHYINSRYVLRNLLHVPVIREDGNKDKRRAGRREKDEYAITSDTLVDIIEESIRILWRFIRSDKDCSNVALKGKRGTSAELQNTEDFELFTEVLKVLRKKERKLKELLRSESCILRRFKKSSDSESDSDQVLYFFSQVDMKLVSRALKMSKLTREQLVWCQNKLSNISFVNGKIHVEPSFLLFPS